MSTKEGTSRCSFRTRSHTKWSSHSIASPARYRTKLFGERPRGNIPRRKNYRLFSKDDCTKRENEAPCADCIDCTAKQERDGLKKSLRNREVVIASQAQRVQAVRRVEEERVRFRYRVKRTLVARSRSTIQIRSRHSREE